MPSHWPALRAREQRAADVAPAVVLERRPVGRRAVGEGEHVAGGLALGGDGSGVRARGGHGIGDHADRARRAAGLARAGGEARAHDVAQIAGRRVGGMRDQAVGRARPRRRSSSVRSRRAGSPARRSASFSGAKKGCMRVSV